MPDASALPHPMTPDRRQRLARLLLWLTPLVWSSNYVIARAADGVIAPHALALGRWSLAFVLMLPLAWRGLRADGMAWRQEWRQLLVLGGLGMWVCGAFVYIGGQTTAAVNIGLIYATTPIVIAVVSARVLHERMTGAQWFGVGLAAAGVLFVVARGQPLHLARVDWVVGDLWILAAALAWCAYSVMLRLWPSRLGPAARLVAITGGGLLVMLPFTLLEWWLMPRLPLTWAAAGLVLAAAVLPGVLAYQAYSFMQREMGASRASLVVYLSPVYAAFSAWALLGEPPRWFHAVGAALILPSIWFSTRAGGVPAAAAPRPR